MWQAGCWGGALADLCGLWLCCKVCILPLCAARACPSAPTLATLIRMGRSPRAPTPLARSGAERCRDVLNGASNRRPQLGPCGAVTSMGELSAPHHGPSLTPTPSTPWFRGAWPPDTLPHPKPAPHPPRAVACSVVCRSSRTGSSTARASRSGATTARSSSGRTACRSVLHVGPRPSALGQRSTASLAPLQGHGQQLGGSCA